MRTCPPLRTLRLALASVILACSSPAFAAFPERPIRLVVSFPPGGASDGVARVLAEGLNARLGVPVVVENQGGAAGTIAGAMVARAAPDGYTMLLSATAVFAMVPNLRKLDFDPLRDLVAVARIGESLRALAVNPKVPVKTLSEFVAYARQNPGKLNYGSSGQGSTVHILTESLRHAAGIDIVHIPYRGAGPSITGLLAGDIEVLMDTVVVPHVQSGKLIGLAAAGEERLPELPDLPTLAEAGYSNVRTSGWTALFGPGPLPKEIVDIYARNIEALFKDETFVKRIVTTGSKPAFLGPVAFADYVRQDNEYFGKVIRELKIKAQD
ncbi:MAG TPA: tripartite tricarboxylate transporter substrate binding protein [Xanthobacteraceae bacterium]|nr:tripartite tricarboxylate transporter substrate binding protein [Xanthobacteraceae bacterium]